jgi:hypothetical protein
MKRGELGLYTSLSWVQRPLIFAWARVFPIRVNTNGYHPNWHVLETQGYQVSQVTKRREMKGGKGREKSRFREYAVLSRRYRGNERNLLRYFKPPRLSVWLQMSSVHRFRASGEGS